MSGFFCIFDLKVLKEYSMFLLKKKMLSIFSCKMKHFLGPPPPLSPPNETVDTGLRRLMTWGGGGMLVVRTVSVSVSVVDLDP